MRIVEINTSAYTEENCYFLTNLSNSQIKKIIAPMVKDERKNDLIYSNEDYYWSLKEAYPKYIVEMYDADNIEELIF